ncbi:MAG: tetratricopeptide repeat protein [Myxococcales bacterium]|nr:tetratricopeptide repeat protein [Myxococcales bacterium]
MTRSKPPKPAPTTGDPLLDAALAALADDPDVEGELYERLRDAPEDGDALFDLGNALDERGRGDDAEKIWRRLVELDPDYSEAWFNLGVAAKNRADWHTALDLFTRAHTTDPDDPSALHCRGHVHQELGDEARGRDDLLRAVDLYAAILDDDPESDEVLFWRAAARARLGERDAALADLAAAVELAPDRRAEARDEVDFQPLAADPEFIRLTQKPGRRKP